MGAPTRVTPAICPCDPQRRYASCCQPPHAGAIAADAETLMRSRYSAYALGLPAYLHSTWHPATRPSLAELEADTDAIRWLGLRVLRSGLLDADHAEVEFIARWRRGGERAGRLHEISRFERTEGRWLYVDGQFPA